jgi:hypothetical protein
LLYGKTSSLNIRYPDMTTFCTIVTPDYIPFAKVLCKSIRRFTPETRFAALVITDELQPYPDPEINWFSLAHLNESVLAKQIISRYLHRNNNNELRWALKPLFITHLLNEGSDQVFYADSDIFFVGDPAFLISDLKACGVLLCPHWQDISPLKPDSLIAVMRNGYFNAGFIGATSKGIPALTWWAEACHFKMEKSIEDGLYDDQKFLNLIPFEFKDVAIISHRGCNLACWNIDTNYRKYINGQLSIAGQYSIVFIHFTVDTINHVLDGADSLLFPYLKEYKEWLNSEGFFLEQNLNKKITAKESNFLVKLKHKSLVRTRFKRFLFQIINKL